MGEAARLGGRDTPGIPRAVQTRAAQEGKNYPKDKQIIRVLEGLPETDRRRRLEPLGAAHKWQSNSLG